MNCHEAYLWMLEAEEPDTAPPLAVAEHLRDCRKCRRRQKRVLRLLTAVQELPPPPESPHARAEVMELVRQTPRLPAKRPLPKVKRRSRRWMWSVVGLTAVAALVLIGLFGWLLSAFREHRDSTTSLPEEVRRLWNDGDLRTRLLQRDLRLAETNTPVEQLDALTGMASDLQHESLAQAGRVDNADLMRLAILYERVLREGVVPHARALPAAERQERLPALTAGLRHTQAEAEQVALKKPASAEPLRRLANAAGQASDLLEKPKSDSQRPSQVQEPTALLIDTLVVQGLRLADEADPLQRADVCTDVADSLVQTIMEASKNNRDREEMIKLGTYLGAMARAAASNLARVDVPAADTKRKARFQSVQQRNENLMDNLRRNIQEATPAARPALEQAVEASNYATLDNNTLTPGKPK